MNDFLPGTQVEVFSGSNVVSSETGQPFWYPAVVTFGPVTLNSGQDGYCLLGLGGSDGDYPFDQEYKPTNMIRPASNDDARLSTRYRKFVAWAYPANA